MTELSQKISNKTPIEVAPARGKNKITIAGAGPVGAMLAIVLARANCQINLFESRPDPRVNCAQQGKSINITLSERAWTALKSIGLDKQVRQFSTAIYKRISHELSGDVTEQSYGGATQAIWSISREKLTEILLNQVEQEPTVNLRFEQRLTHVDFNSACTSFSYLKAGKSGHIEVDADYVFAADGAFSKVRRLAQETPRFSYSQRYMQQCYIELTIAANKDGSAKLTNNICHLWPREDFLLMALPNNDGSFTCTLYLDFQGQISFSSLTQRHSVEAFFQQYFAEVLPLLEDPIETFLNKTANPLFLVSVDPWVINNKVTLIGDAAHAMVPFYGQGLNCSFEDCFKLGQIIKLHHGDWAKILPDYYLKRKENADAISKLSKDYFFKVSSSNESSYDVLEKKIADEFAKKHPDLWPSLDQMLCFSPEISYARARKISQQQKLIMTEVMKIAHIELCWQDDFVYARQRELANSKIAPLLK